MSDLISSLADQIVALTNASPRSPTKTQIEEVLRKHYEPFLRTVPGFLRSEAGGVCDRCGGTFPLRRLDRVEHEKSYFTVCKSCQTVWKDEAYRAEAEKVSRALRDAMNTTVYGGPTVEDREKFWAKKLNEPFMTEGSPGTEGDAAAGGLSSIASTNKGVHEDIIKAMAEIRANKRDGRYDFPENALYRRLKEKEENAEAMRIIGALGIHPELTPKSALLCPGSTDGSHLWEEVERPGTANSDVNVFRNPMRCACGAVKP